jgi:methylenetetrahydrofolate dehydrogenase (NADP+) / methenyltetrahydrofolate cyclohydrolase
MLFQNQKLKTELLSFLRSKVANQSQLPVLNIVQIGNNLSSTRYVNLKKKIGLELGLQVKHVHFEEEVNLDNLNLKPIFDSKQGLIFQLPIPDNYWSIMRNIPYQCDVDLLSDEAEILWQVGFLPPTVQAVDLVIKQMMQQKNMLKVELDSVQKLLESKLDLSGYRVAVIGQGVLVGRPLIRYLLDRGATILTINKETENPADLVKLADIVLSGAGVPKLVKNSWLKKDCIVIDVATSNSNGVLVGDVDIENLDESVFICPSPGGVGPLTVLCLFWNLVKLSDLK